MKTRTAKRSGAALAVLAGLSLALTGCGGSNEASNGSGGDTGGDAAVTQEASADVAVFDFEQAKLDKYDQEAFVATDQPVVVQLSDELKAAIPDGASVLVDSYTLTAKAFPATGMCRLDIDIKYTSDNALSTYVARTGADDEQSAVEDMIGFYSSTIVDTVPTDDELGNDYSDWITSDYTHAVRVADCIDQSRDGTATDAQLEFGYATPPSWEDADTQEDFAQVDAEVYGGSQGGTNDGSTTITLNEAVTKADVSVNGNWVKPTE